MNREELLKIAKPILFNTEMVRAILEGRKSVTRRVLKTNKYIPEDAKFGYTTFTPETYISVRAHFEDDMYGESFIKLPYHKGDFLYVRETWSEWTGGYVYKAWTSPFLQPGRYSDSVMKWHPSIHMPKEAARIFLRVKDVRVERLQDITDDDIIAEGLEIGCFFEDLWDSTIERKYLDHYGWNANPWVWVIEFERIEECE